MSGIQALLEANRRTATDFDQAKLPIMPRLATILVSCVDARVDPAHIFDLDRGDAIVIRNAGGRITPEVQRELATLGFLAAQMPGGGEVKPEVVIIHHTDCGMSRLTNTDLQTALAEKLGVDQSDIAAMAITDPATTVLNDVERLRQSPGSPQGMRITAIVYDVDTGIAEQVTGSDRIDPSPSGRLSTVEADSAHAQNPERR